MEAKNLFSTAKTKYPFPQANNGKVSRGFLKIPFLFFSLKKVTKCFHYRKVDEEIAFLFYAPMTFWCYYHLHWNFQCVQFLIHEIVRLPNWISIWSTTVPKSHHQDWTWNWRQFFRSNIEFSLLTASKDSRSLQFGNCFCFFVLFLSWVC